MRNKRTITAASPLGFQVEFLRRDSASDANADWQWTNQPAAQTELFGRAVNRRVFDLSYAHQVWFACELNSGGTLNTGAFLDLQYSTDLVTPSWTDLNLDIVMSQGAWTVSGWKGLPAGARRQALWRVVGEGGDGVKDPIFHTIQAMFR